MIYGSGNTLMDIQDRRREENEKYCPDCNELWRFCECEKSEANQETDQSGQSQSTVPVGDAKSEDTERPSVKLRSDIWKNHNQSQS